MCVQTQLANSRFALARILNTHYIPWRRRGWGRDLWATATQDWRARGTCGSSWASSASCRTAFPPRTVGRSSSAGAACRCTHLSNQNSPNICYAAVTTSISYIKHFLGCKFFHHYENIHAERLFYGDLPRVIFAGIFWIHCKNSPSTPSHKMFFLTSSEMGLKFEPNV